MYIKRVYTATHRVCYSSFVMIPKVLHQREQLLLLLGDIIFFYIALWITLTIRYLEWPKPEVIDIHLLPFSILFFIWIVVFYIAGLYERYIAIVKRSLPTVVTETLLINSALAVLFFYFIPFFGITPKTNLFIYLIISLTLLLFWRLNLFPLIAPKTIHNAMLIARGEEMKELKEEVNSSKYYGYVFTHSINLEKVDCINVQQDIVNVVYANSISTVVIDTKDDTVIPLLPYFYNLMFSHISFIDMQNMYEEVFGRVPLSLVKHGWFLENVHSKPHIMYDTLKRLMDILFALILGVISLIFYPFIILALKIEGGKVIFVQERIGKNNKMIKLFKFRTMKYANNGEDLDNKENYVTKVGAFLRNTRLDELPQLWNVLGGSISLIGPRPELADAVHKYREEVPYYNVRHLIKPGLSGWAQIYGDHPHHSVDVTLTKNKLAHDLFYIKNRSFILDLKIALKTVKTMVSRKGR